MTEPPRHSVSVAGIVVNGRGNILVIKRRDNGEWQPPGGVLEMSETIEDGLRREIEEETGIEAAIERLTGVYKNMHLGVIALVFRCRRSGGDIRTNDEATQVRWVPPDEVESLMTPAFAIRVEDALGESMTVKLRSHDGSGSGLT